MLAMAAKVQSGDPANVEGQAARAYWGLLFGRQFRRDQDAEGINSLLNYGYKILRATVARHLIAAGLHPGIPLHHANAGNAMRLVDDVMEPFRPLVDAWVRRLSDLGVAAVNPDSKRALALLPVRTLHTDAGTSPIAAVIQGACVSLAQVYEAPSNKLRLPPDNAEGLRSIWEENSGPEAEQTEE